MSSVNAKSQPFDQKKSVIQEILEVNSIDLTGLAENLGIDYRTLWQYRKGLREFKLNMSQIKALDRLLMKTGKRLADLPPDWILDKN